MICEFGFFFLKDLGFVVCLYWGGGGGIGLLWEKELWRKWEREELGFIVGEGEGVDAGKVVKGGSSCWVSANSVFEF